MTSGPVALQPVPSLTECVTEFTSVAAGSVVLGLKVVPGLAVGCGGLATRQAGKVARASSLEKLFTRALKVRVGANKGGS